MKKNIKVFIALLGIILFAIGCTVKTSKNEISDKDVHEKIVEKESGYWFKRSLSLVLLNRLIGEKTQVLWSTNNHTAAPVPLGAVGPDKYVHKLQGILQNDSLGRVVKEAVNDGVNVILVIGDGMGNMHMALPVYKRYGEHSKEKTYFERIMSEGACGYLYTCTARGLVTGSAASGTAIACGKKTLMNMVAVDSMGNDLKSSLKLAKEKGFTTALVTDAGITDATPAVFYAHSYNRDLESNIALQLAKSNDVDVIFGGGASQFIPANSNFSQFYKGEGYPDFSSVRQDSLNLFDILSKSGYKMCFTTREMNDLEATKIIGLFSGGGLPATIERNESNRSIPTVAQMADKALKLMDKGSNPYFSMIECGRIDWEAHDNDVVSVYKAVEEMNTVLSGAYAHYKRNPKNTLLIFTADHETGGLEIAYKKVDESEKESRVLKDSMTWENNTMPLFFSDFEQHMDSQDETMSKIISSSKTKEELRHNLKQHAHIELTKSEAELLFYAKHGYKKYKNE